MEHLIGIETSPVTKKNMDIVNIRLTSSELADLWSAYLEGTMLKNEVSYFMSKVEDKEIRSLLDFTLSVTRKSIDNLTEIYHREKHPIPIGFSEADVNLDAPRLFSDSLILYYLEFVAAIRLDGFNVALQDSSRADIRHLFNECLADAMEFHNRTVALMQSKGIYIRPPQIPIPEKMEYVKRQNFLAGYFGEQRPLTSIEISHIFEIIKRYSFIMALYTGFGKVAKSEQVRKHMLRGVEIASKQISVLSPLLFQDNLPVTMPWDTGVMESDTTPFSDKMIMDIVRKKIALLIARYGKALTVLMRHDLMVDFSRLMMETGKYAEDGVNIMIDNGWLQEPPQAEGAKKLH